jgi:serine/threonine protein kinase
MDEGINLMKYILLKPLELTRIFYGILSGISAIHDAGFGHCDIKPENVIVVNDIAKVIDLGISRELNDTHQPRVPSWYQSPELCGSYTTSISDRDDLLGFFSQNIDREKVDVWSLGCLLYQMIIGEPLFPYDDIKLRKHLEEYISNPGVYIASKSAGKYLLIEPYMYLILDMLEPTVKERSAIKKLMSNDIFKDLINTDEMNLSTLSFSQCGGNELISCPIKSSPGILDLGSFPPSIREYLQMFTTLLYESYQYEIRINRFLTLFNKSYITLHKLEKRSVLLLGSTCMYLINRLMECCYPSLLELSRIASVSQQTILDHTVKVVVICDGILI